MKVINATTVHFNRPGIFKKYTTVNHICTFVRNNQKTRVVLLKEKICYSSCTISIKCMLLIKREVPKYGITAFWDHFDVCSSEKWSFLWKESLLSELRLQTSLWPTHRQAGSTRDVKKTHTAFWFRPRIFIVFAFQQMERRWTWTGVSVTELHHSKRLNHESDVV